MDNTDTSRIIVESVAQYLARGGKVTVGPSVRAKGFVDALIKVKGSEGSRRRISKRQITSENQSTRFNSICLN